MPLYDPENPFSRGQGLLKQAGQTTAAMDKDESIDPPGKTIGGGIMAGAGGAMAGASIGSLAGIGAMTGGTGLAIAAGVGLLAYFLS